MTRSPATGGQKNAVWYSPAGAASKTALFNTTDGTVLVRLSSSRNPDGEQFEMPPYSGKTVGFSTRATAAIDWMHIETPGATGAVRCTGFTSDKRSYQSSIRFFDPGMAQSPDLHASNIDVSGSALHVVVRNVSSQQVTLTPVVAGSEESPKMMNLPEVTLAAGEAAELPLSNAASVASKAGAVTLHIGNSGSPGSIVAAQTSSDTSGGTQDIPVKEVGLRSRNTGGYPWRIDGNYSSVAFIVNVGSVKAKYIAKIAYAGGSYLFAPRELAPGATATFDMRQIRDLQQRDPNGQIIPLSIERGRFRWSILGSAKDAHLNGRLQLTNIPKAIRRSYSCENSCCPDSGIFPYYYGSGLSTTPNRGTYDTLYGHVDSCNGSSDEWPYGPDSGSDSGDTSVATSDSGGGVVGAIGVSGGGILDRCNWR